MPPSWSQVWRISVPGFPSVGGAGHCPRLRGITRERSSGRLLSATVLTGHLGWLAHLPVVAPGGIGVSDLLLGLPASGQLVAQIRTAATRPSVALVAAALIALAGAGLVLLWMWSSTRPSRPEEGPATSELGPEPPALVDLLTGGFRVEGDAIAATAVDLAARRYFDIDDVGQGNVILTRRRRQPDGEVTRYEKRVLDHVFGRSVDGVTPAAALTLGPEGVSRRWYRGFVREVNSDGRSRGLCRRRWDFVHLAVVWGAVAVVWAVNVLAALTADRGEAIGSAVDPWSMALGVSFLGASGLAYVARRITRSDAQADTPEGLAAASRWLGVRRYFVDHGNFAEQPAPAVKIWERNLAYATAMGLAPRVQAQLPFETEDDHTAWSRETGTWRRVKVRYLSWIPSWGVHPLRVAFTGLVQVVIWGIVGYLALTVARGDVELSSLPEDTRRILNLAAAVVVVAMVPLLLLGLIRLVLGLWDLFPRRTIEGELVRTREFQTGHRLPRVIQWMLWSGRDESGMRRDQRRRTRWYVAVDDGTSDRIVAYSCRSDLWKGVRQGGRVRMKVSPRLGYVSSLEQISPPPSGSGPAVAHELVEDLTDRMGEKMGAVIGGLGASLARMQDMTDEQGRPLLDQPAGEGGTLRDKLEEAREALGQARRQGEGIGVKRGDGSSLLGGLFDRIEEGLAAGAADPGNGGEGSGPGATDRDEDRNA